MSKLTIIKGDGNKSFDDIDKRSKLVYGLTSSQVEARDSIEDWFINNRSLKYSLSGSAGTGKTFLINHLIKTVFRKYRVLVTAPTHKAVRVIEQFTNVKGMTLHSLHGLRPNFNINNFNINQLRFESSGVNKFNNYDLVIADEGSMIGKDLSNLNSIRSIQYNTKILYLGDKLQLLPVGETNISDVFNSQYDYELTEIVRQQTSNPIIKLLTILRDDIKLNQSKFLPYINKNTKEISGDHGYVYINGNALKEYIDMIISSSEFKDNVDAYKVGTFTNASVNTWNKYIRAKFIKSSDVLTVGDRLLAYKTIVNEHMATIITNGTDYLVDSLVVRITEDNFKIYTTSLLDIMTGNIKVIHIVDHSDKSFINYYNKLCTLHRNAMYSDKLKRGSFWKTYYDFKDTFLCMVDFDLVYSGTKQGRVTREIDYNFAVTVHKLQGSTIKNIILDVNNICYIRGNASNGMYDIQTRNRLLYTGLSRASNMGILLNI